MVLPSTCEAEYKTQTYTFKEEIYFKNILHSETNVQITPVQTNVDNVNSAYMPEQLVTDKRSEHVSLAYHYAREHVHIFNNYSLEYTLLNSSDIFTNALEEVCSKDTDTVFSKSELIGTNNWTTLQKEDKKVVLICISQGGCQYSSFSNDFHIYEYGLVRTAWPTNI